MCVCFCTEGFRPRYTRGCASNSKSCGSRFAIQKATCEQRVCVCVCVSIIRVRCGRRTLVNSDHWRGNVVCVCAYVFVPRVLARGVEGRSSDRACVCVCSCTEEFRLRRRLQRRPGCYSGGYTTAAARPRPPACYTTAPNRTGGYTTFSAAHTTPKVTAVRGRHSRPWHLW